MPIVSSEQIKAVEFMSQHRKLLILFLLVSGLVVISPLLGFSPETGLTFGDVSSKVIWQLRLPRMLAALSCGAVLSLIGLVFQAYFRNWLASPYTLGISSGASAGASLWIVCSGMLGIYGTYYTGCAALLGAILTICLLTMITARCRYVGSTTLLLAGIAINFMFSSITVMAQLLANHYDTAKIVHWLMGSITDISLIEVWPICVVVLPLFIVFFMLRNELNLINVNEDFAITRGVSVTLLRRIIIIGGSLATALVVATCGPIGFVGIICPHICRLLFGANHQWLIPASLLLGGGFLVVCDLISRLCSVWFLFPIGVMTSLIGIPIFLFLLVKNQRETL